MKLTGGLKEKFDGAETPEEKKKVLAEAGIELNDVELEGVAGGSGMRINSSKDDAAGIQISDRMSKI